MPSPFLLKRCKSSHSKETTQDVHLLDDQQLLRSFPAPPATTWPLSSPHQVSVNGDSYCSTTEHIARSYDRGVRSPTFRPTPSHAVIGKSQPGPSRPNGKYVRSFSSPCITADQAGYGQPGAGGSIEPATQMSGQAGYSKRDRPEQRSEQSTTRGRSSQRAPQKSVTHPMEAPSPSDDDVTRRRHRKPPEVRRLPSDTLIDVTLPSDALPTQKVCISQGQAMGKGIALRRDPPALEVGPTINASEKVNIASQDDIDEDLISLGTITISEDDDLEYVRKASEGTSTKRPACAEDALLQVISTTLELLESGKESDLFRSCAVFVQSAHNGA